MIKRLSALGAKRLNMGLCLVLAIFILSSLALLPRIRAERGT